MAHEEYLDRRKELQKIRSDSFDSFDRTILTLATGTLVLSITFLDKIGKPFNDCTYKLILATWIGLFIVVLCNLLSYLFAQRNMYRKIKALDEEYKKQNSNQEAKVVPEKNFWQRMATTCCNYCAMGCFLLSILSFTRYIVIVQKENLRIIKKNSQPKEDDMGIKKTAGKTETNMAVSKNQQPGGKELFQGAETEIPSAVTKPLSPTGQTPTSENKTLTGEPGGGRGVTETPPAVPIVSPTGQTPTFENKTLTGGDGGGKGLTETPPAVPKPQPDKPAPDSSSSDSDSGN